MLTRFTTLAIALCIAANATAVLAQSAMRNGLPATSMDSFVNQAGAQAEMIYGDESHGTGEMCSNNAPPINGFEPSNRIEAGILGQRSAGLTTGHGSYMPDGWGRDEFIGNEWSMSGSGQPASLVTTPSFSLTLGSGQGNSPLISAQASFPAPQAMQSLISTGAPLAMQAGSTPAMSAPFPPSALSVLSTASGF